jgi:hypothetical protein
MPVRACADHLIAIFGILTATITAANSLLRTIGTFR